MTLILSTTYIFGIEYYDTAEQKISELYRLVQIEGINYEQVKLSLTGIKNNEQLELTDLLTLQESALRILSHEVECSKFCKRTHYYHAEKSVSPEDSGFVSLATHMDDETSYILSIKNQQDIHYNTYYSMEFTGLEDLAELDKLRNRGLEIFKDVKVEPKEYIYFIGELTGFLEEEEKEFYVYKLFDALGAKQTNRYIDDLSNKALAYYGYTRQIKDYITEIDGDRTNVQISFSEHEIEGVTKVTIAFPFFNEPF